MVRIALHHGPGLFRGKDRAPVERIHIIALPGELHLDQKISRQIHAGRGDPEIVKDLEVEDGEGHGDAQTPFQHFIEEAVLGIVVFAEVALELQLLEQDLTDDLQDTVKIRGTAFDLYTGSNGLSITFDAPYIVINVQLRILLLGEKKRRFNEVYPAVGLFDLFLKEVIQDSPLSLSTKKCYVCFCFHSEFK
jgi:hypothetical protein